MKMPTIPTPIPRTCGRWTATPKAAAPTRTVATGIALLSIPVTDESIHCWANGNSVKGKAIQVMPRISSRPRSERSTGRRAAGKQARAASPNTGRSQVMRPGCSASRATSMNRNDEPQMVAAATRSNQSKAPKGRRSASRGAGASFRSDAAIEANYRRT